MKKYLPAVLTAILFCFILTGIARAAQCVYLGSVGEYSHYYDPASVKYSGDIVSYMSYSNAECNEDIYTDYNEIDCVKKIIRHRDIETGEWTDWKNLGAGAPSDNARIKLCK